MGGRQLVVKSVSPGSIAEELGIKPGDVILRINEQEVMDIIDYRFLIADEEVNILLQKPDGHRWLLEIEKDWDEELGLTFQHGGLGKTIRCQNRCIFCFVDQMPPKMRKSLYVKDDDYRLSFTQGNFITLTNASERDLERIARMRLSPLYVSVHTTNPELRARMMGNRRAAKIMEQLKYLAGAGIEIHAQVVLCPGINDGRELEKTVADLTGLWPSVRSLALVPVGLTCYRENLYPLRSFTGPEARQVIEKVHCWQDECVRRYGYPLVFASDEFYLLAGENIPPASRYGGFPQTENGVGLVRLFLDQWKEEKAKLPSSIPAGRNVLLVTGKLAEPVLEPAARRLNEIKNLTVNLVAVENKFFGYSVTVAGLLTASDIMEQVKATEETDAVIIPSVALRADMPVFLDNPTLDDLSRKLGVPVKTAGNPKELIQAAAGITV